MCCDVNIFEKKIVSLLKYNMTFYASRNLMKNGLPYRKNEVEPEEQELDALDTLVHLDAGCSRPTRCG